MAAFDVFLSHNLRDKPAVEQLARTLQKRGLRVWLDLWELRPGLPWQLEIERVIDSIGAAAVLVGQDGLGPWAEQEMRACLTQFVERRLPVIPVLLPEAPQEPELPLFLRAFTWVDLQHDDAVDRLIWGITGRRTAEELHRASSTVACKPVVWNVPHLRNHHFTGREPMLAALRGRLASGQPTALTQTISGLGGVGKTQLAVEYVYRWRREYNVIWWLRAEETSAINEDLDLLANALELKVRNPRETIEAVRRWLEENEGWLLVFDNAEDVADLRTFIPRRLVGHVLITSRNPFWRGLAETFEVPVFNPKESRDFLLGTTQSRDAAAADTLAKALGHLPLALEQAAAYIDVTSLEPAKYLELFRQHRGRLLKRGRPASDYPGTVATTWQISFLKLEKEVPSAADLLRLLAFLGSEQISESLLHRSAEYLPSPLSQSLMDPLATQDILLALRKFSLIQREKGAFSIHRLVQTVIRDQLAAAADDWARVAVQIVDRLFAFDPDLPETWQRCAELLHHALEVLSLDEVDAEDLATASLLHSAGSYLYHRAQLDEARGLLQDAVQNYRKILGDNDPQLLPIRTSLTIVEQALGHWKSVRKELSLNLKSQSRQEDSEPTATACTLNGLGLVDLAMAEPQPARDHFLQALELYQEEMGSEHAAIATVLNNMALMELAVENFETAQQDFKIALKIAQKAYAPDHPTVAAIESNQGLTWAITAALYGTFEFDTANPCLERAMEIDRVAYGEDHPIIGLRRNNLSTIVFFKGDTRRALVMFEEACEIQETFFGPHHPALAFFLNNLALARASIGDLEGARNTLERTQRIVEIAYDDHHPLLATVLYNVGSVLEALDDLELARQTLQRTLRLEERSAMRSDVLRASILNNLGCVHEAEGHLIQAKECFDQAIELGWQSPDPSSHFKVILNNLGSVEEALGDLETAEEHFRTAIDYDDRLVGGTQPSRSVALNNLARIYEASGELAEARHLLRIALSIDQRFLDAADPRLADRYNSLGVVLYHTANEPRDLNEARNHFERAIAIFETASGSYNTSLKTVLHNLGWVMQALDQSVEAKDCFLRSESIASDELCRPSVAELPALLCSAIGNISAGGEVSGGAAAAHGIALLLFPRILCGSAYGSLRAVRPRRVTALRDPKVLLEEGASREDLFESSYKRHFGNIMLFFVRRGFPREEAEDLAQETFMAAYRGLQSLRGDARIEVWIFSIASNIWKNELRRSKMPKHARAVAASDVNLESLQSTLPRADDILERQEQSLLVHQAIETLPPRMRRCLLLRMQYEMNYRDIANTLKISIETVKVNLFQARKRLKEALGR